MGSCCVDLLGQADGGIPLAMVTGAFAEAEEGGGARGVEEVDEVGAPVHEPSSTSKSLTRSVR